MIINIRSKREIKLTLIALFLYRVLKNKTTCTLFHSTLELYFLLIIFVLTYFDPAKLLKENGKQETYLT